MSSPRELAAALRGADPVAVLSGAGVSVGSDVPAFRGRDGLWDRFDPTEYATLSAFREDPAKVWAMLRELNRILDAAEPNGAHRALAELQRRGVVGTIVTQNVDGLHQAAADGPVDVVEIHGTRETLSCLSCGSTVGRERVVEEVEAGRVPRCRECDGLLKPDAVFFGEQLPPEAVRRAEVAARGCELLLIVGTSAEVYPVADLPRLAAGAGAELWEVNPSPAVASAQPVAGPAEEVLPAVVDHLDGD